MIPTTLEECFIELDNGLMAHTEQENIMHEPEEVMIEFHHGLGRFIRNNWGLWESATLGGTIAIEPKGLAKYFNDLGILHADDMSGIILTSYWRYKHNKPLDIEGQVKHYKDYWAALSGAEDDK